MGQGSGAQGTSRGFNQLKKGHEAVRVTLPFRDFRKNAEPLMCGLTTEWILESAQSLACALIRRTFYALERRTTHSSEWEGTQTLRMERQAHRWPSGWGEQCWLDQQGERPITEITELGGAENSFLRMRGKLRRSAGSGMLKDDPLMRGVMLALPITSSGGRRTHSSEWEGTQTLSRERHAHR